MKNKLLAVLILFSISTSVNAQIFSQDFESSNSKLTYISSTPDIGEFSGISNSPEVVTSITNGALRFQKTAIGSSYFYRTPNPALTPEPTFIQMKFDFEVTNNDPNHPDPQNRRNIPFYFGPSYNAQVASINSSFCAFGLNISANEGKFYLTVEPNGTESIEFSGKQEITFVANKTGSVQTYNAPDGTEENIANHTWEIWVGTTKIFNDIPARKHDLSFSSFKFQYNSFLPLATLDFDNFEFKDFLTNPNSGSGSQSLVHPHIWASNADRQGILDNINNHNWASSLFNQLVERHAGRKSTHSGNPVAEITLIPNIPGDRTQHRARLNVGAECAILYYLTRDENYAQIAADILHQYVKMLSIQDGKTFEFYDTSFNHLIPPRELFTRVAIIYDFVQPFLSKSTTTVYDKDSNSQVSFNFNTSQDAFEVMATNVIDVGGNNSNHPVLELPGGLYSVMCMEDDAIRASFFNKLLNGAANSKQPGINWMLGRFSDQERLWPESTGYGKFTHALFIQLMNIIDQYKPDLNIIENNQDLLESIFIYENFLYPNGKTMAYGDINRNFVDHAHIFRSILKIADRKGYSSLKNRAATTLQKIYSEEGGYNPLIQDQRLEWNNPLQLLWGVNLDASVSNLGEPKYSTVTAKHAGVVMQRNYSGVDDELNGLMYYTHGGTYVHTHAGGIDMELYGSGYVIGPDYGADSFGTDIHEQYAVSYAAHNTVIVNGTSGRGPKLNGNGTWQNITDKVVLEATEPVAYASPIADNFSFATQFLDDNINNLDQQRTNCIVRTSATSGYYVDIFRSVSNEVNNYHDYLFHGLGDVMQINEQNGSPLPLTNTPERFQNDVGDDRKQPGWRWFSNAKTSALTSEAVNSRFHLQFDDKYLHVSVPNGIEREYTSALAPPTKEVSNGYKNKDTQVFMIRKYGEAWNSPFIAIYEPSSNAVGTVESTKHIFNDGKIVGVEILSQVEGQQIRDVILSNTDNQTAISLNNYEINFTGRFAIVRTEVVNDKTNVSLYIGDGKELTFNGQTLNAENENKGYLEYTLDYVYTPPVLSSLTIPLLKKIKVYPNPSEGFFEIDVPSNLDIITLEVYNTYSQLIGSKTHQIKNGNILLNLEEKPSGVYFVKVNSKNPLFIKLVKK